MSDEEMKNLDLGKLFGPPKEETPEEIEARQVEQAKWKADNDKRVFEQAEAIRLAVPREMEQLRKEAADKIMEAERLGRLLEKYPDLLQHTTRGRTRYYYSKAVNGLVNKLSFRESCSCGHCRDSPVDVWLYVETPDGPVYSNPVKFHIGHEDPSYGGHLPQKGWQVGLREAGISEAVIDCVKEHFRKSAEEVRERAARLYDGHEVEDMDPAI